MTISSLKSHCTLREARSLAKTVWGSRIAGQNQRFFKQAWLIAEKISQKAKDAGFGTDFNRNRFYAAAALAVTSHMKEDGPHLRKSGELYVYHMLRILDRLTQSDVPYLGHAAYEAAWLHDTLEDTKLKKSAIVKLFGRRVAGIVDALSKLKIKASTKLGAADLYDPKFIGSISDHVEAIYIKMADLDDYFNTCEKMSPESKYLHFRFVDEIVYPIAVAMVGAREMALNVANKALQKNRSSEYARLSRKIEELIAPLKQRKLTDRFADILKKNGVPGKVIIQIRTPYELFITNRDKKMGRALKAKRSYQIDESLRAEIHYDRTGKYVPYSHDYVDHDKVLAAEIMSLPPKTDPALNLRNALLINIIAANQQECYAIQQSLLSILSAVLGRGRDFIQEGKPNGYRALHEEFKIKGQSFRVRIFTDHMDRLNRLGLAATTYAAAGMPSLDSPFLSIPAQTMLLSGTREDRKQILQSLPRVRQLEARVTRLPDQKLLTTAFPWIHQKACGLDLAAAIHPRYALRFRSGRWGKREIKDPTARANWYMGQKADIYVDRSWTGYDLYHYLQAPFAADAVKAHIARLSPKKQTNIGRTMYERALNNIAPDALLRDKLLDLQTAVRESRLHVLSGVAELHDYLMNKYNWERPNDFYRMIALGEIPLLRLLNIIHNYSVY